MTELADPIQPSLETRRGLVALWALAGAVAWLGAMIMFEANPGVNWGVWTIAASAGFVTVVRRSGGRVTLELGVALLLACLLAAGATVTASPLFQGLIVIGTMTLMGMAALLATDSAPERVDASFIMWAPIVAFARSIMESGRRGAQATEKLFAERTRPVVRGAAIAIPVVGLFAVMLSAADPILAAWRDGIVRALEGWIFLPRLIFFVMLLVAALGAYGLVARGAPVRVPVLNVGGVGPLFRVGSTERLMVFGGVAGLFGLFLLLQISYLFGNSPAVSGSGVTFAEYAHRGFGELSVVATLCSLLIVVLDRVALRGEREGVVRMLQLAVILETQCLLISAFRRLAIYEAAYGFTTLRLYAQVYLVVVSIVLTMLSWEVWRSLDLRRLARRTASVAALAVIGLTYWNHEAWIARENIGRYARSGKLDDAYLARDLSHNAIPAILAKLAALPPDLAKGPRSTLAARYAQNALARCSWYEWNLRERQAVLALVRHGILVGDSVQGCVRIGRRQAASGKR